MAGPNRVLGSVADMMAGLMIVFLFLLVCFMYNANVGEKQVIQVKKEIIELTNEIKRLKEENTLLSAEKTQKDLQIKKTQQTIDQILEQASLDQNKVLIKFYDAEEKIKNLEAQNSKTEQTNEKIKQETMEYFQTQTSIAKALKTEFKNDLLSWGASVESDGTVRFKDPAVLFKQNEFKLTPGGEQILKNFFKRFVEVLYSTNFKDKIGEIRVEGHTSTEWSQGTSEIQRYIWNLDLSQKRAFEILRICLPSISNLEYFEVVKNQAIAIGHSSSKIIRNEDNSENRELSRRVDFRAITNSEKILKEISGFCPNENSKIESD